MQQVWQRFSDLMFSTVGKVYLGLAAFILFCLALSPLKAPNQYDDFLSNGVSVSATVTETGAHPEDRHEVSKGRFRHNLKLESELIIHEEHRFIGFRYEVAGESYWGGYHQHRESDLQQTEVIENLLWNAKKTGQVDIRYLPSDPHRYITEHELQARLSQAALNRVILVIVAAMVVAPVFVVFGYSLWSSFQPEPKRVPSNTAKSLLSGLEQE